MNAQIPLAQRMRPQTLAEIIGQNHLLADDAPITRMVAHNYLPSLIFHGEAGIGKTTIATLLAQAVHRPFYALSAINSGMKHIREVLDMAENQSQRHVNPNTKRNTMCTQDIFTDESDINELSKNSIFSSTLAQPVVFIDEIHRFNKSQQDALLGAVEAGTITLIGATTENPSFSVNNALLSRCQVYRLQLLTDKQIHTIVQRAIDVDAVLQELNITLATTKISTFASGDARKALNILELAVHTARHDNSAHRGNEQKITITDKLVLQVAQTALSRYDKNGENHYDMISAMIKSIRGSDPDASLYWLARMLVGGEDVIFIARRLVILASEDIGNANPNALLLADTALRSVQSIGMPEARIILGQVVVYLATCAKSNSTYKAINKAMQLAKGDESPVPLHLRNINERDMSATDNVDHTYIYPHDYPNHYHPQSYLPTSLIGTQLYIYGDNRREQHSKKFMQWLQDTHAVNDE